MDYGLTSKLENPPEKKKWTLQKESEFRFEVQESIKLILISGFAECFGSELAQGKEYTFSNCSSYDIFATVYTYNILVVFSLGKAALLK
jgi:hypothetical protein